MRILAWATLTATALAAADTDRWDFDFGFSGINTFAHLPHVKCLTHPEESFDIGIIGAPFDTAVSYRPGARFGPRAIRSNSQRQTSFRGFNAKTGVNAYHNWAKIIDCGDIPITPMDNAVALHEMDEAYAQLAESPRANVHPDAPKTPRLITLGGDHSISLPVLRTLKKHYGPISVIHFDSHLDTWSPASYPTQWMSKQSEFTHGTMFHLAAQEGCIANGTSIHGGLRTRLSGLDYGDYLHDEEVGFKFIEAHEIDNLGVQGVINRVKATVGDTPVYLSIDIDVIDPGLAPGTGTPETGGWTTREMKAIVQGLADLNIVGADVVEVAPAYDNAGETTALAAADLVFEILGIMVSNPRFASVPGYVAPQKFLPRNPFKFDINYLPSHAEYRDEL